MIQSSKAPWHSAYTGYMGHLRSPQVFFSVDFHMLFDARQCGGPDGGYSEAHI